MFWLAEPLVKIIEVFEVNSTLLGIKGGFFVHEQYRLPDRDGFVDRGRFPLLDADDLLVSSEVEVYAGDCIVELVELSFPLR